MKLLLYTSCGDIKSLSFRTRSCECGTASGRYLNDGHHAEISGATARVLLVGNGSLRLALNGQAHRMPPAGGGTKVWAVIAGPDHPRIHRK